MSYKTIMLLCLHSTVCSQKTISNTIKVCDYCELQEFDGPVNLGFESIKEELANFKRSRAPYEAFWVRVTGGQRLFYCRIQLQDHDMCSWGGAEGAKPQPTHRMGYPQVEQMFASIPSAHYTYTEQPFANYASEPELEAILVKKAGVTIYMRKLL